METYAEGVRMIIVCLSVVSVLLATSAALAYVNERRDNAKRDKASAS